MINPRTYTYKSVGDCEIRADVYPSPGSSRRPVVVFLHGGGLVMGNRQGSPFLIDVLLGAGYIVVSGDYRLAPETKLEGIVDDLRDLLRWVRSDGPSLFDAEPDRVAVMGNSAGGYLTLMTGCVTAPPPRALVSLYGYGDVDGPWLTEPDPFYCSQPPVSKEAAWSSVGSKPISSSPVPGDRGAFYLYCRQRGLLPKEVTGYDPATEGERYDPYCPVRNVTPRYPPTLLLHGDADMDVPYAESVAMLESLRRATVECELVTMPGRAHDFERPGLSDPLVTDAIGRVLSFLNLHL